MQVLQPLIERIETTIMASDLLHADDTPIRVLDRSLRDKGMGKGVKKGKDLDICPRSASMGRQFPARCSLLFCS
jgi:hypothetical protein